MSLRILLADDHAVVRQGVRQLLLDLIVRPRRFGNVQPPFIVQRRHDRPLNQRRPGRKLNRKTFRHFQVACGTLGILCRMNRADGY